MLARRARPSLHTALCRCRRRPLPPATPPLLPHIVHSAAIRTVRYPLAQQKLPKPTVLTSKTPNHQPKTPASQVCWFYRPEESIGGRKAFHGERELFVSDHTDWQHVEPILGKCAVHKIQRYQARAPPRPRGCVCTSPKTF